MELMKFKEALKSTIAKKVYKSFILVFCLFGFVLLMTNPNMDDFKEFSQSDGMIYKQELYDFKRIDYFNMIQRKERNYFLFSIYSDKIKYKYEFMGDTYCDETHIYIGILKNFYTVESWQYYYYRNQFLKTMVVYSFFNY